MKRRRVLLTFTVSQSLIFAAGLAEYLRRRGWDVGAASGAGPELDRMRSAGFHVAAIPFVRRLSLVSDLRAWSAVRSAVRSFAPDVVHASTPKAGMLTMLAALGLPARRLYHMRGLPLETARGPMAGALWLSEFISCRTAHRVLCVSRSLRKAALERRLVPETKAIVLGAGSGQGVDCARFDRARLGPSARAEFRLRHGIPAAAFVFGYVGRFARDKGMTELRAAWQVVAQGCPNAHLVLIGDQDVRQNATDELRSLLEIPRVHHQPQAAEMPNVYVGVDAVVLPTYREGLPNVLLEAGAMRLPAIASAVTGCVDVVASGATGRLVAARDPAALAEAMAGYLRDPELAARHGAAARDHVCRNFRQERVWAELEQLYEELLEHPEGL